MDVEHLAIAVSGDGDEFAIGGAEIAEFGDAGAPQVAELAAGSPLACPDFRLKTAENALFWPKE